MKKESIQIDQAGRLVLPKSVRQELAIKPGDFLYISIQGISVTLTPNKAKRGLVRKGKALIFTTFHGENLKNEDVNRVLADARGERDELNFGRLKNQSIES